VGPRHHQGRREGGQGGEGSSGGSGQGGGRQAAAAKAAAERAAKKVAAEAAAKAKALAAKAKAKTKKNAGDGSACPVPHSFVAGTAVLLADGTSKPIEEVEPGDTVAATDPATGESGDRQVTHTIRTDDDEQFVDVTVTGSDGEQHTITTTEHHPFWSETRKDWVNAGDLREGELLRTAAGTYVQLSAVRSYEDEERTYDLTVDGLHTYYVVAGESSVLVHNNNAACGWTNGKTTSANAETLRDNMVAEGWYGAVGEEAHHIVPSNHPRAAASRKILHDFDIDINHTANGVFLPGWSGAPNPFNKSVHRGNGLHSYQGIDRVTDMLRQAATRDDAIEVLGNIRTSLMSQNGGLP
jgi:hypothetical protein